MHTKRVLLIGSNVKEDIRTSMMQSFQEEFSQGLARAGISGEVSICHYDEISFLISKDSFVVTDHHNNEELSTYDLVIFKGAIRRSYIAQIICTYLISRGVRFMNNYTRYRTINKLAQLVEMHMLGLSLPKTLYIENRQLFIGILKTAWKFPLVIKSINSSRGRYNFLVQSLKETQDILRKYPKIQFMAEEYIAKGSNYRILCIGEETLLFERGQKEAQYLKNTAQGVSITQLPLKTISSEVIIQARALMEKMQMTIAGIDVIYESDSTYAFLEINAQPAIGHPTSFDPLSRLLKAQLS